MSNAQKWVYAPAFENNAPDYYLIATKLFKGVFIARTDTEEKARLIAAAPDLLEALLMVESCFAPEDNDRMAQKVRAAIAKAGVQS